MVTEDSGKVEGTVSPFPLVAYETFVPHGVLCGLNLWYLEAPADVLGGQVSSVPLILTPNMARALADALIKSADEAENGPIGEMAH
jgi:hypothetical protein